MASSTSMAWRGSEEMPKTMTRRQARWGRLDGVKGLGLGEEALVDLGAALGPQRLLACGSESETCQGRSWWTAGPDPAVMMPPPEQRLPALVLGQGSRVLLGGSAHPRPAARPEPVGAIDLILVVEVGQALGELLAAPARRHRRRESRAAGPARRLLQRGRPARRDRRAAGRAASSSGALS